MKRLSPVWLLAAVLAVGCTKESGAEPAPKAQAAPAGTGGSGGGTEVPELPLVADVPAGAEPNAGAPGFHSNDDRLSVLIREASEPGTMAEKKQALEAFGFKSWLKSEPTKDGWALRYVGVGIDMSGNEYTKYNFELRRTVDGKAYDCYGGVKKKEDLEANVKVCESLRAK